MGKIVSIILCGLFLGGAEVYASPASTYEEIPAGESQTIDFDKDGHPEKIIKGWRENFNAHGYSIINFYTETKNTLNLIPIFDGNKEKESLRTIEGADCMLQDYWIVRRSDNTLALLQANRPLRASYADAELVTFTLYTIKQNPESVSGHPAIYFAADKIWISAKEYCDVKDAVKSELN